MNKSFSAPAEVKNKITVINQDEMEDAQKKLANDEIFQDLLQYGDMFFESKGDHTPLFAFERDFKTRLAQKHHCSRSNILHRIRQASRLKLLLHKDISVYILNPKFFRVEC